MYCGGLDERIGGHEYLLLYARVTRRYGRLTVVTLQCGRFLLVGHLLLLLVWQWHLCALVNSSRLGMLLCLMVLLSGCVGAGGDRLLILLLLVVLLLLLIMLLLL